MAFIGKRTEKRTKDKNLLKTIYIFQCDICNIVFEKTGGSSHQRAKQERHYCTVDCTRIALKKGGIAQQAMEATCKSLYGVSSILTLENQTRNIIKSRSPEANEKRNKTITSKGYHPNFNSKLELFVLPELQQLGFLHNKYACGYQVDFLHEEKKIIVEINGDFWHTNPKTYVSDYVHPIMNLTAQQIWDRDAKKRSTFESAGYKFVVMWEDDLRKNKSNEISKVCETINNYDGAFSNALS